MTSDSQSRSPPIASPIPSSSSLSPPPVYPPPAHASSDISPPDPFHYIDNILDVSNTQRNGTRSLPSFSDILVYIICLLSGIIADTVDVLTNALVDFSARRSRKRLPTGIVTTPTITGKNIATPGTSSSSDIPQTKVANPETPNAPHHSGWQVSELNQPDCNSSTEWYVVFVGRQVGIFTTWYAFNFILFVLNVDLTLLA